MAKIFRTETLDLAGNIRLASSATNAFEITNSGGSTLMSKATIESDISSLHAQRVADESTTDTDVSSLMAKSTKDESDLSVDISSLQAQRVADESTTDTDISSLHASVASNDVVAVSSAINGAATPQSSATISFGRTFASTPKVIGLLKGGANSPIIACMLSNISTTGATFQFSDDITTDGEYTLEILASI